MLSIVWLLSKINRPTETAFSHAELRFADTLLEHLNKVQPRRELSDTALAKNIQGLDNNFRGLAAELEVAKAAPDLVAISEVFPFGPPGQPKGNAG